MCPNAFHVGVKVLVKDFHCKKRVNGKMGLKDTLCHSSSPKELVKDLGLYGLKLVANLAHTISRNNGAYLKHHHIPQPTMCGDSSALSR